MSCDAPGCINKIVNRSPKQMQLEEKIGRITFFKYPYHYPVLFQKWKDFVNIKDWMPTYDSRICSQHFEDKWFDKTQNLKFKRLKPYAYPTIPTRLVDHDTKTSYCHVPGCDSSESKIKYRLVRFPQAKDRKEFSRWIENIMNFPAATRDLIQKINSESRVCVDHFEPECFRVLNNKQILRYGSVPTLNLLGTPVHRNLFNDTPKIAVVEKDDVDIPKCAVSFCGSKFFESKDIAFHPFPMDWAQNILWIQAAKPYNNDQKFEYLCSKHFKEECFESELTRILKKGSVPSVFPNKKLKVQDIEEILLPHSTRSISNLLDNLADPLASDKLNLPQNIPVISKTIQKNCPALNPLKRSSSANITSDIPPKLVMLSKNTTEMPKKKLIIVKKNISGNNEISLMSTDKKITFVPKNSIQIMSSKNAEFNKIMSCAKNCLDEKTGPSSQCSCGTEVKIQSNKEKIIVSRTNCKKKIEKQIISKVLDDSKNVTPNKVDNIPDLVLRNDASEEFIFVKSPEKNIKQKNLPDNILAENVSSPEVESTILKNTLENTNKGSKTMKVKQKYFFLQCNDVKVKRKILKKPNFETKNINSSADENNLEPNSHLLSNLDSRILDKIKKINGKIVQILPVLKTNDELHLPVDNNPNSFSHKIIQNLAPPVKTDQIIKVKNFDISLKKNAQNVEPVQNPVTQNEPNINTGKNLVEGIFEKRNSPSIISKSHKIETSSKKNAQKDNFVSCTIVDLTEHVNQDTNDSADQNDDVIPVIPKDPLALSDDENNSEIDDTKSLLVPMKTVQKVRNRKTPRKVLIKYVDQKRSMDSTPLKKIMRKSKNNIDPFLLKRKNLKDKFDRKITEMIPKVILKDIFHGKSPLNSNIRITVHTRTLPKFYQKPKELPQNEPIDLDHFEEKIPPKKRVHRTDPKNLHENVTSSKTRTTSSKDDEVLLLRDLELSQNNDNLVRKDRVESQKEEIVIRKRPSTSRVEDSSKKVVPLSSIVTRRGLKVDYQKLIQSPLDSKPRESKKAVIKCKNEEKIPTPDSIPKEDSIESKNTLNVSRTIRTRSKSPKKTMLSIGELQKLNNEINSKKIETQKSIEDSKYKSQKVIEDKKFQILCPEPKNDENILSFKIEKPVIRKARVGPLCSKLKTSGFKLVKIPQLESIENKLSIETQEFHTQEVVTQNIEKDSLELVQIDNESNIESDTNLEKTKELVPKNKMLEPVNDIEEQLSEFLVTKIHNDNILIGNVNFENNVNGKFVPFQIFNELVLEKLDISEVPILENDTSKLNDENIEETCSDQGQVEAKTSVVDNSELNKTIEITENDVAKIVEEFLPKENETIPKETSQNQEQNDHKNSELSIEMQLQNMENDHFNSDSEEYAHLIEFPGISVKEKNSEKSPVEISTNVQINTKLDMPALDAFSDIPEAEIQVEVSTNEISEVDKPENEPQIEVRNDVDNLQIDTTETVTEVDTLKVTSQVQPEVDTLEVASQVLPDVDTLEVASQVLPDVDTLEVASQVLPEVDTLEVASQVQPEVNIPNFISEVNIPEVDTLEVASQVQLEVDIPNFITEANIPEVDIPKITSEVDITEIGTSVVCLSEVENKVISELATPNISEVDIPRVPDIYIPEVTKEVINDVVTSEIYMSEVGKPEVDIHEVNTNEVSLNEVGIPEMIESQNILYSHIDLDIEKVDSLEIKVQNDSANLESVENSTEINIEKTELNMESIETSNIIPNIVDSNNISKSITPVSENYSQSISMNPKTETTIQNDINTSISVKNSINNDCVTQSIDKTITQDNETPEKNTIQDCLNIETQINKPILVDNATNISDSMFTSIAVQVDTEILKTDTKKHKNHATYKIKRLGKKLKEKNAYIKKLTARNKMLEYRYKMAECKTRLLTKEHMDLYSLLEDFDPNNKILKKIRKIK